MSPRHQATYQVYKAKCINLVYNKASQLILCLNFHYLIGINKLIQIAGLNRNREIWYIKCLHTSNQPFSSSTFCLFKDFSNIMQSNIERNKYVVVVSFHFLVGCQTNSFILFRLPNKFDCRVKLTR
jgi:hypothetical protein